MDYPIKVVAGNWFKLTQPLSKIVWENSTREIVDYEPQEGDTFKVTLIGSYSPYEMQDAHIKEDTTNVLVYENNGTLPLGLYDIEIRVVLADGRRLRSYQTDIVKIVKTNREASIPNTTEFGIDTFELQGAVFMYVPNSSGSFKQVQADWEQDDSSEVDYIKNKPIIPSTTSDLTNDSGFLTSETDPTVPSWAKQESKPTYTAQEVGALPANTPIPSASDATPLMDGVGNSGTASTFARADHRHPSDTTKQDVINDLADIRSGASKGNTAYQKPSNGIPKTDLANDVQTSLGKADNAIQKSSSSTGLLKPNGEVDNSTYLTQHQDISGKANTSDLSNVAFSGNYGDLDNKPTIPAAGDVNVIEEVQVNGVALTPDANKAVNVQVPTNTNQLTNGAGFITSSCYPIDTTKQSEAGGTSQDHIGIYAEKYYKLGTVNQIYVDLIATDNTKAQEWVMEFVAGADNIPVAITKAAGTPDIRYAAGTPTYTSGHTYQMSIQESLAIVVDFAPNQQV